jgi:glutamine cyclotransferase
MMGSASVFGEGITILNEKIYQLTWQSNVAYVYNINDITKPIQTFKWPYEGWGITNNGTDLIISDGSANLYFVNPQDFKVKSTIAVQTNLGPVDNLNELEWIDGSVYANIYTTDKIVKIDPESGHVTGIMELKNLLQPNEVVEGRTDVLNGIAYDSATKTMYVTGKRWPKLFEVKLN